MNKEGIVDQLRACIQREQNVDGAFWNLQTRSLKDFSQAQQEVTTFCTSQILFLASDLLSPTSRDTAKEFLRRQIHPKAGSINYWPRGSEMATFKPYPDDFDDTACGWLALGKMDGGELARLSQALIACESREGGPYRTWLVPETAPAVWLDLDVVVNANIATMLAAQEISLDGLNAFLDEAIETGRLSSPYYPDAIPVLYFLTRARSNVKREELIRHWNSLKVGDGWGDAMRTAMAISSLKRLGVVIDVESWLTKSHEMVLPFAFCLDPAEQGQTTYAGSAGLTAAFCYEAIRTMESSLNVEADTGSVDESAHEEIVAMAIREIGDVGLLSEGAWKVIEKMSAKDLKRQITLTPYRLMEALGRTNVREVAIEAGVGSLFGWAAYTLYDDVWDGDAGASVLPLANLFHRRMSEVFSGIFLDKPWRQSMLDQVDSANAWEMMHCRITIANGRIVLPTGTPNGLDDALIGRSIGHVIGPGAVLQACGWEINQPAFLSVMEIYRAYILARQLHDDAHDWEGDLKRGQLNAASFAIIEAWKGPREIVLEDFLQKAREIFWMEIIPGYSERIIRICENATRMTESISDIKQPEKLTAMFEVPLRGAKQALSERGKTLEFLTTFPQ